MESKLGKKRISSTVSDKVNSILPTIFSLDYFMEPCRKTLKVREQTHPGYCRRVKDFTVGRVGYGRVKFFGETDVRGLELDTIVKFPKNQVSVYKKEEGKPAIGYGLNKSAEVTLIIHIDPAKEMHILEPELKHLSMAQGSDFISFNSKTMEWKFSVNHFSRFGLNLDRQEEEEEEEEEEMDEVMEEGGVGSDQGGWLSHSLPAHLGLDPLKLKELKRVMWPEEEDMNRETPSLSLVMTDLQPSLSSRRRAPLPLIEYCLGNTGLRFINNMKLSSQHNKVKPHWNKVDGDGGLFNFEALDSRNVVDAGLFLGRSFRVGWGPGAVLVRPCSSGVSVNLDKVAIDGVVRDEYGEVNEELVDSCFISPFKLHHKHVHSRVVEIGFDSFKLDLREASTDPLYLSEICQKYIDLVEKRMNTPGLLYPYTRQALAHQIMVWGLIRVLFSVIDTSSLEKDNVDVVSLPLVRRAEFSCWVQESMYEMTSSDKLEQILFLLTSRQIEDAVRLAVDRGDVRLACLLSQAGGFPVNRLDLERQLEIWQNGIDFDFLEHGRVRLYKLLSGRIHGALEGINIDWRRFLGVFMWYHLAPDMELPSVFDAYQRLLVEGGAPPPLPLYMAREEDEGGRFDLAYYLMLLHAAREKGTVFPYLKEMFTASASTEDPLDHHMIWHQRSILEAVGVVESDGLHLLDMGVVSQLLCLGQCHWAIYVALHMCRSYGFPHLHSSLIREILFLYCETWSSRDEQYRFIESLGVPPEWLHESMAVYYNYYGNLPKAMEHYIGCSNWQKAHSIFVISVSHSLFLMGEEEEIVRIVIKMEEHKSEIENWEVGAGLYSSFFFLKDAFREPDSATVASLENVCTDFFATLKESLIVFDDKLPLDARVAYSKMAGEICDLLVSLDGDEVAAEAQLRRFVVVFTSPVVDHVCSAHFQDALSNFTSSLTHTCLL